MPETKPTPDAQRRIVYVGGDGTYWKKLTRLFSETYPDMDWTFSRLDVGGGEEPWPEAALKILGQDPKIVFLDFTSEPGEKAKLSRFLSRDGALPGPPRRPR